ncbi:MAG TPA: carboxypeptidase-like regulatory domain-containing protein [Pyrinomonadaceae bacterium]
MLKIIRNLVSPVLLCLALFGGALAQDTQVAKKTEAVQAQTEGSMVTGRAIYEDTGQPATRERVQLISSETLSNLHGRIRIPTAITNENGEFSLRRIAAGEYYIFARPVDEHIRSGETLPIWQFGESATDAARLEQFKKDYIKIAVDGQHNLDVNLRVPNPHYGVISGRILDAEGKPAVRAAVHLISSGEKSFGASVVTDEQGQYKFRGLPAGEYIISASPPPKKRDEGDSPRGLEGLAGATFFPSTLDSRSSPPVIVLPDRDTGNIDVTLISRNLHSLSGMVRMRNDKRAVTNATLRLTRKEIADPSSEASSAAGIEGPMSTYFNTTDKTGNWSFANVPDGSYHLFVQPMAGELAKERFVQTEQNIIVDGADVEGLLVEVSQGSRISGVVSVEGNNASPQVIRVGASQYKGNTNSGVSIDEAGKFELTAIPPGEITVSAFPLPQDKFYVKSIEANGLDLLRTTLTIAEGEEIKDVQIVISPSVGVVTGRVLSLAGDKPIAGINVMLHRIGDDKPRLFGGKLMGVTDDRGNFILSAAPGVYLVIAWRAGSSAFGDAMNKALREQRSSLTLLPNDRKQLDIRIP